MTHKQHYCRKTLAEALGLAYHTMYGWERVGWTPKPSNRIGGKVYYTDFELTQIVNYFNNWAGANGRNAVRLDTL